MVVTKLAESYGSRGVSLEEVVCSGLLWIKFFHKSWKEVCGDSFFVLVYNILVNLDGDVCWFLLYIAFFSFYLKKLIYYFLSLFFLLLNKLFSLIGFAWFCSSIEFYINNFNVLLLYRGFYFKIKGSGFIGGVFYVLVESVNEGGGLKLIRGDYISLIVEKFYIVSFVNSFFFILFEKFSFEKGIKILLLIIWEDWVLRAYGLGEYLVLEGDVVLKNVGFVFSCFYLFFCRLFYKWVIILLIEGGNIVLVIFFTFLFFLFWFWWTVSFDIGICFFFFKTGLKLLLLKALFDVKLPRGNRFCNFLSFFLVVVFSIYLLQLCIILSVFPFK